MPKSKSDKPEKPPFIGVAFRGSSADIYKAMLKLQARDGISFSGQTRRALAAWLTKQGVYTPKKETR